MYLDGDIPVDLWLDLSDRSLDWKVAVMDRIADQQAEKQLKRRNLQEKKEKIKQEVQKQICEAIEQATQQSVDGIADEVAGQVVADLDSTLNGGQPQTAHTWATDLGVLVGRALGDAPFKLLDELLDEACK